ncbi:MAG: transposase [bacterium]
MFFLTACCRDMQPYLDTPSARDIVADEIRYVSNGKPGWVYCYAVLPDHFHLLVLLPKHVSPCDLIRLIKGRASAGLGKLGLRNVWNRSFHDRMIRNEMEMKETGRYILDNPVRRELVSKPQEWPWCGILDWKG